MPSTRGGPVARAALLQPEGAALAPGSARSLLVTVLGELVRPAGEPVRTSTLVHVLAGLGVEEQTARQAIARAASSGWIAGERRGREVSWSLAPKLVRIFDSGSPRVYSLSDPYLEWDGTWLMLLVSVPQEQRAARRPLYAGLTWAGFGNPVPGLWLTPHVERADEVRSLVGDLGLRPHTVSLLGSVDETTGMTEREIVARGWDLAGLREHYEQVEDAVARLRPDGDDETLLAHVRMISAWQELPRTDPQLPEALLPDWVGRRVAGTIERQREQWTPVVRHRFAELNR